MNHEMLHWVHSQTKPHKIPFAFYFALRGSIIIYYFFWVRHSGCRVARLFRIDWTNEEEKMFFFVCFFSGTILISVLVHHGSIKSPSHFI